MRHLFISDPLASFGLTQDTTLVFMREAAGRGHGVFSCEVPDLDVGPGGRPRARVRELAIDAAAIDRRDPAWYEASPAEATFLDTFDVVWMRKDPPVDERFTRVVQILALVAPPACVVNDPAGLLAIEEKLFVLGYPDLAPPSLVSADIGRLLAFREEQGGEMILKPIGGCGGEGVFHLTKGDRNAGTILEVATQGGRVYQIAQRYIPEIRDGDKRVIVVDGEPLGAVMRVPLATSTRANFHAGGSAAKAEVTDRDREICARIAPALRQNGILFAGLDVIGGYLTEVNVTSPTGVQEIDRLDGTCLEARVLDAVERRVASRA